MKIGIFTFHCAINYGAVLQAYGLQEYLKGLGHEVYIIDYRPDYLLYPYRIFRWNESPKHPINRLKWFIRELMVIPIRCRRKIHFSRFVKKYLNLYDLDLNNPNNDFDAFVFGSDQIWNKEITNGFDKVYWGDFPAARGKQLVAYAASMGNCCDLQNHDLEYIDRKIGLFSVIGVRESSLSNLLRSYNKPSINVVDPVLLAGDALFKKLIIKKRNLRPYLLLFTLGRDEYVIPIANKIAKDLGLETIEVISSNESLNLKLKQTLSPIDFLSVLYHASYVVTSSFHGTVFSILFQKNFSAVQLESTKSDRIESLLSIADLSSRLVCESTQKIDTSSIDYTYVFEKILDVVSKSRDFMHHKIG